MNLDFGSTYNRRLPVYFVIGTGDSMKGVSIQTVEQGLHELYKELLSQPQALEQVWMSFITFATNAKQITPLEPLTTLSIPHFVAEGDYNLGEGLKCLVKALQGEIQLSSASKKGDYKPLVFLIFDNNPTDRWERELSSIEKARADKRLGSLIAIGLGEQVNLSVFRQLTDSILWLDNFKPEQLHSFFRWTSVSVSTVSRSMTLFPSDTVVPLPPPPDGCKIVM